MRYMRLALKCYEKIILKNIKVLENASLAAIFLFLCVWTWNSLNGAIACPPISKLTKQVFFKSYEVLAAWSQIAHCIDADLFGKPPKLQAS